MKRSDVIRRHRFHGCGLQHLLAVRLAAIEHHADELEIVAGGAVEPAAAQLELGLLRYLQIHQRCELFVVAALVDLGKALPHGRRDPERRVLHAKRVQEVLLQYRPQLFSAGRFHCLPTKSMLMP